MVDSIQARSSVPLPPTQTELGSQSPTTVNSPKDIRTQDSAAAAKKTDAGADSFADYLNHSSITTLPKVETDRFDPVAEIVAFSVYAQPGGSII